MTSVRLDDTISCVKWGRYISGRYHLRTPVLGDSNISHLRLFADSQCVTATTDDGRFFQFDIRTDMKKASLFVDTQKLVISAIISTFFVEITCALCSGFIHARVLQRQFLPLRIRRWRTTPCRHEKPQVVSCVLHCIGSLQQRLKQCCVLSLQGTRDPYVSVIGDLHFNSNRDELLISGESQYGCCHDCRIGAEKCGDRFSIWKLGRSTGIAEAM